MRLTRRQLLAGAGAGAAALPFGSRLAGHRAEAQSLPLGVAFDPAPFTLGVASGDPLPESVILWTRLAPEPLVEAGASLGGSGVNEAVEVDWVVAEDPRLRRVVRTGTTMAGPELGYSVHVDPGGLEPGRTYWYRFAALGRVSRIGRTRTAPVGPTGRVRFAYVSCSNFQHGYFGAYRHLAREDLDLVVCLGDYFYEYPTGEYGGFRDHQPFETQGLEEYRQRHALYKGDPDLRAAHAAFPWVVTWDDHEFDNNYADLVPEANTEDSANATPESFAQRRSDSYQADYEHLPLRLPQPDDLANATDLRIYRRLLFGDLLQMDVVDTRQYRTDQPCQNPEDGSDGFIVVRCPEQDDPEATILGAEQKTWLLDGLERSTAAWRVVANQVMFSALFSQGTPTSGLPVPVGEAVYFNADQWDGYLAERGEVVRFLGERGVPDTFVITGDIHSHWVHDVKQDFLDPGSPVVATEYVGTSITSDGFGPAVGAEGEQVARADFYLANPHLRFFEGLSYGYAVCEVTPDAVTNAFRVVSDREARFPTISTLAAFRQDRGDPLVTQVDGGLANPRR